MFLQVNLPTPVLNTPDFRFAFGGKTGSEIPVNEQGHSPYFEFVALKGSSFQIEEMIEKNPVPIYRVSSPFYPSQNLYIDSRAAQITKKCTTPKMPEKQVVLDRIRKMRGTAYVWGGNWSLGLPEMLLFYPPKTQLDPKNHLLWTLRGVDCSGLLYEATRGASPRNTSQLVDYGYPITDFSQLQPLDMIVYPGHVLFVLDVHTCIESRPSYGVIEGSLSQRFEEISASRKLVENWSSHLDPQKHFTLRRFLPDCSI